MVEISILEIILSSVWMFLHLQLQTLRSIQNNPKFKREEEQVASGQNPNRENEKQFEEVWKVLRRHEAFLNNSKKRLRRKYGDCEIARMLEEPIPTQQEVQEITRTHHRQQRERR
jgi:hypothetical protein